MKQLKKITLDQGMYITGIIVFIVLIPIHFLYFNALNNGQFDSCFVLKYFGIYCPGCGGSRAFYAFLHGRFIESFIYHPIVPYTGVIYILFMSTQTLQLLSKGRIKGIHFHYWFLYGAIVVIALNFLIKNILLLCFYITFI